MLFVQTGHTYFNFNQCSIFTESCFKKGSNGKNHFPSGPYHPIQNIHPPKFPIPLPLNAIFKNPVSSIFNQKKS